MAAPRDVSSVESGPDSLSLSNETTSLLHEQGIPHYGPNTANERPHVPTNRRENSHSNEPGSSSKPPSQSLQTQKSVSSLDAFAKTPVDWIWCRLTEGWGDEVSLTLQNSGSVARDHLALERTFLAYTRTSLALASAGVALVQLFNTSNKAETDRIERYARPLGGSVIALGVIVLSIGLTRYFVVQSALVKGIFPVARVSPTFIAITLTALVTVVFSILVAGKLEF